MVHTGLSDDPSDRMTIEGRGGKRGETWIERNSQFLAKKTHGNYSAPKKENLEHN